MIEATVLLLEKAELQAQARRVQAEVADYEQVAELFRRITSLDSRTRAPELARLQNLNRPVPPSKITVGGKLHNLFFRMVNPVLGRLLRAASLASPFQAAYELAIHLHQQQLETECKILAEVAAVRARLEILESEIRARS
jgi:hypothetical protein